MVHEEPAIQDDGVVSRGNVCGSRLSEAYSSSCSIQEHARDISSSMPTLNLLLMLWASFSHFVVTLQRRRMEA